MSAHRDIDELNKAAPEVRGAQRASAAACVCPCHRGVAGNFHCWGDCCAAPVIGSAYGEERCPQCRVGVLSSQCKCALGDKRYSCGHETNVCPVHRKVNLGQSDHARATRCTCAAVVGDNTPDAFKKNPWMKDAFGAVHTGGGVVLSMFGAGALVKPLTELEAGAGLLPDWAKGGLTPTVGSVAVNKPDYAVIVHALAGVKPDVIEAPTAVLVAGGKRLDGNGYKTGDGVNKTFSFGYDTPTKVEWVDSKGSKSAASDVKQILFLGGAEQNQTQVKGAIMSDYVLGSEIIGASVPKKPARRKPSRSLNGAIVSATAAAANADRAGRSAVAASKRKVAPPRTATKIGAVYDTSTGDVTFDDAITDAVLGGGIGIYGGDDDGGSVEIVGGAGNDDGSSVEIVGGAGNDDGSSVEIVGNGGSQWLELIGASPATQALAAQAASVRAQLLSARSRAAGAPQKVAKANASIDRHGQSVAAFVRRAGAAEAKGAAAIAKAKSSKQAIKDQIARLKKLKITIGADAESDKQMYERMPGDAIPFPEGRAWDTGSRGSWLTFYGTPPAGYAWQADRWWFSYGPGGPAAVDLRGWTDAGVSVASTTGQDFKGGFGSAGAGVAGATFGPLIGNPAMPDFAGLRYASKEGKWFWLNGEAPLWATKERDDALALLEQQTLEAQNAADAAAQAEAEQRQAEADAKAADLQAKHDLEDAEFARKAEVQAAELQLQDEKLQAELAQQQAQDDQTQARIDQDFENRSRQAALDYALQHPEAVEAQQAAAPQQASQRGDELFAEDARRADDGGLEATAAEDMYSDPFTE